MDISARTEVQKAKAKLKSGFLKNEINGMIFHYHPGQAQKDYVVALDEKVEEDAAQLKAQGLTKEHLAEAKAQGKALFEKFEAEKAQLYKGMAQTVKEQEAIAAENKLDAPEPTKIPDMWETSEGETIEKMRARCTELKLKVPEKATKEMMRKAIQDHVAQAPFPQKPGKPKASKPQEAKPVVAPKA